jgi:hypothetical protein
MPDLMLSYRAAAFFSRVFCPDLTGGFNSTDELQECGAQAIPTPKETANPLEAEIKETATPRE